MRQETITQGPTITLDGLPESDTWYLFIVHNRGETGKVQERGCARARCLAKILAADCADYAERGGTGAGRAPAVQIRESRGTKAADNADGLLPSDVILLANRIRTAGPVHGSRGNISNGSVPSVNIRVIRVLGQPVPGLLTTCDRVRQQHHLVLAPGCGVPGTAPFSLYFKNERDNRRCQPTYRWSTRAAPSAHVHAGVGLRRPLRPPNPFARRH